MDLRHLPLAKYNQIDVPLSGPKVRIKHSKRTFPTVFPRAAASLQISAFVSTCKPVQVAIPRVFRFLWMCTCSSYSIPVRIPTALPGCTKKTKLPSFSSQANYTDWATAAFLRIDGVAWSEQRVPMAVNLDFLDPEPLFFHSSRSSVILTRLSEPRSRLTTSQKIW
jgi:hypothetical protein